MIERKSTILISGLVNQARIADVRRIATAMPEEIILASVPCDGHDQQTRTECLDLTAIIDAEAFAVTCRAWATRGQLVLVRDHQLGFENIVEEITHLCLRCIVLYPHISYDVDLSWVLGRLTDLSSRVQVEHFALDLFCDVEDAWNFLTHQVQDDEFGISDLRQVCDEFPVLLSADIGLENVTDIVSFPGTRGILLTCDELKPRVPLERHVLQFDVIVQLLHLLLNRRGGGSGGTRSTEPDA